MPYGYKQRLKKTMKDQIQKRFAKFDEIDRERRAKNKSYSAIQTCTIFPKKSKTSIFPSFEPGPAGSVHPKSSRGQSFSSSKSKSRGGNLISLAKTNAKADKTTSRSSSLLPFNGNIRTPGIMGKNISSQKRMRNKKASTKSRPASGKKYN
eukprot:CAMPEP_0197533292 /NCGR_PEP_ID=MMETSP1318-20131121/42983_1 /TAXON_ID=552666 /ORGANISM="Partenskyella glossopodia, Strain RCC365" /LENGTH=150 /DNA_ID=CAMNT_0043090147 /DNA_START=30 /DNA_END=479 /DNA_ORIENTATION=-